VSSMIAVTVYGAATSRVSAAFAVCNARSAASIWSRAFPSATRDCSESDFVTIFAFTFATLAFICWVAWSIAACAATRCSIDASTA